MDSSEQVSPKSWGSDWTMFHGNAQHTGSAKDKLDAGLTWIGHTEPLVRSLLLRLRSQMEWYTLEHGMRRAVAIMPFMQWTKKTGEKLWQVNAEAQVQSSPAVADGIVYASSIRGTVYA